MRAVRFVERLEWELPGTIFRHGLTIGDVDNDGDNELVVGTAEGEVYIFKGAEIWQKITGLGLVTCIAIGDIFNYGCNALVVICGDGWAHIFYGPRSVNPSTMAPIDLLTASSCVSSTSSSSSPDNGNGNETYGKMECVHLQRIPSNSKIVIVADIDRDGANEMIIGLTDRVVRSYRWSTNIDLGAGKLIGLNKWECANQIGTVTLQHTCEGIPTLLVGQPGGTFMRIKCDPDICHEDNDNDEDECEDDAYAAASCVDYQTLGISRMRNPNISTEIIGDLEPGAIHCCSSLPSSSSDNHHDKHPKFVPKAKFRRNFSQPDILCDSAEKITCEARFYSRVNSPEIDNNSCRLESTEKALVTKKDSNKLKKSKPYALATLDGTIMLVKDETILWAMQVDHQVFALCRLDVTGDDADEIVACTWDGQTYILDQQRRSVRFQFEEPVRAFATGKYSVKSGSTTPSLIYNTFGNKLFLYYDVLLPSMVITPPNPLKDIEFDQQKFIDDILASCEDDGDADADRNKRLASLMEYLLYGTNKQ